MATVKMNVSGLGSPIQGLYGTYYPGADGMVSVDSRDAVNMLAAGATYVYGDTRYYTTLAVAAAAAGFFLASTALVNGNGTVAAQPVIPRPAQILVNTAAAAITAGTFTVPYYANDGSLQTDVFSLVTGGTSTSTLYTSKGIAHLFTPTVAGLVGGTTPNIQMGSIGAISLPVSSGAQDVKVLKENVDSTDETVGTMATGILASLTPTTAFNGTHAFSFLYVVNEPET